MAEKVSATLWAKWDAKLYNWALCYSGLDRQAPISEAYDALELGKRTGEVRDDKARAAVWETPEPPGITGDAMDVQALVIRLPGSLYSAVRAYWCLALPVDEKARAINAHVSTLYRRVDEAIIELERMDGALRRGERPNPITGKPGSAAVVRRSTFVPDNPDG